MVSKNLIFQRSDYIFLGALNQGLSCTRPKNVYYWYPRTLYLIYKKKTMPFQAISDILVILDNQNSDNRLVKMKDFTQRDGGPDSDAKTDLRPP